MDSTWCLIKMVIPPQESPHKEYIYPLNLKQAIGVTLPETIAAKARENGPNLPLLRKWITVQLVVRVGTLGFWASFVGTTWDRKSHQHLSQIRLPSGELTWQLKSLIFKWDYIHLQIMHVPLLSLFTGVGSIGCGSNVSDRKWKPDLGMASSTDQNGTKNRRKFSEFRILLKSSSLNEKMSPAGTNHLQRSIGTWKHIHSRKLTWIPKIMVWKR